jgi:hypothetical protein
MRRSAPANEWKRDADFSFLSASPASSAPYLQRNGTQSSDLCGRFYQVGQRSCDTAVFGLNFLKQLGRFCEIGRFGH